MKTINKLTLLSLIASMLLLGSCKKEKIEEEHEHNHDTTGSTTVNLATSYNVNGASFHQDSIYQDGFGNDYKFTLVRIYLSKPTVLDHDNVSTNFSTGYILLDPTVASHSLGTIASGHYHDLTFNIGVDSVTNHSDPNTYPVSSPLYPQSPSMHWSWNSGYIFYKLEGVVDTDNNGTFESTFTYHIGTDALLRNKTITIHKDFEANETASINLSIDLYKFLTNVDIETEASTHTMGNMPLATKIADNSITAFTVN